MTTSPRYAITADRFLAWAEETGWPVRDPSCLDYAGYEWAEHVLEEELPKSWFLSRGSALKFLDPPLRCHGLPWMAEGTKMVAMERPVGSHAPVLLPGAVGAAAVATAGPGTRGSAVSQLLAARMKPAGKPGPQALRVQGLNTP